MAGIYNNNNPIPGNGADFFGDKLVGNQFVDGVSQFTLGNFEIKSNVSQKDSRDFSLGNFSEPISLETLNITSTEEAKILASNRLDVFINYSRSKISNFTLYGSLRERIKVAVQNVIKKFPAALVFKKIRDWKDFKSGDTATNISFNATTNKTNLSLHLFNLYNPFSIEFTKTGNLYTDPNVSALRNLTLEYKKYSLFYKNVEYPLTFLTPTTGNTDTGNLNIVLEGNPFSGSSATTESFYIKPNTLTTEEEFDKMEDVEQFLVERNTTPIYTATFDQPRETETGKIVKSTVSITWPSTDNWNLIISGGLFNAYLAKLYDIADTYDSYKTNLVSRFLTTAALKEFDTYDEKVDKILKIYGRSFDEIKKYIDGLAYMTNVSYDGLDNIPNELLKNFAQTLGWGTPSSIKNEGFLDTIFKRNTTTEYAGLAQNPTPVELDYELYRRLLANTAYLFKSKGTRRGIEFMLRFVGAPEALIEFNEHVYVAGQPLNMREFKNYELKISGGTFTEDIPVQQTYFSAATNTFPPIVITGYTFGYETITKTTNIIPEVLPVDKDGYPTIPRYGADSYFQSGAGWFEETIEHQGKKVIDYETSVFTGNTPFIRTKLNQFSYGEPYLDLYRKFPDSKLGFPIVRTVDNKKSWIKKDSHQQRYLNLPDRGTNYQTENDKLVINVKNVDIFLNIGQGLEWDVWNFSKKYSCPFGPNALNSPYPGVGGPDWTEVVADASKLSFFEFSQKFWTVLINVKNRQTIDDGHAGGYPTLLSIYLDYLKSDQTCGIPSNRYTYEKMIAYVENMGDYWVRLLEQLVPSTTIWQGGIKYENSIFHRYKYAYKHEPLCDDLECFGSFVHCCYPIANDILVDATLECGGLTFSGATWQNKITLGGTVYTGNTYYSSTTITDIPSTDIWLDDMVEILSGITMDVTDPNHNLTYYLINDNNTPTGIQIDQPNCIVIQGPCGTGEEVCDCPPGYEYDAVSELCVSYTASTSTTGTTISKAAGVTSYNQYGARFCVPGSYTTCGSGAPASNFNIIGSGSPFWDSNGTTTQGRLNNVGVNNADMIASDHFFGFSRCIDVPEKGEYLFALAGDDEIRANLNGVQIVNNPWNGGISANNYRYWWVWPVTLNAGQNTLTLEGANGFSGGPASFGCEIVGPFSAGTFTVNTDFDMFSTQDGIDAYTANTIFSSLNEVGNTFNTQTNTCPSGYTYDVCTDSCVKTAPTECITYPDGQDVWNFNTGSDPHCFKSEICLTLETTQVNPVPNGTDIWAFYDTTSTGADMANAAKTSLDSWVSSLGTSFTGNTFHLPVGDERWLSWATIPISGGTVSAAGYGGSFSVLPSSSVGNTIPAGVSTNVLSIFFIDETHPNYHTAWVANSCGYNPPMGVVADWVTQPTSVYTLDFNDFMSAFNVYDNFKGFIYPIVKDANAVRMNFPLHVYGALEPSTVAVSDLIENPTVTAAGGSLSAITLTNPYTGLTGTNLTTAYTGPGLKNFGFGANYSLGTDSCAGLTCTDPGFQASCLTSDASRFFDGTFQQDLFTFLQGSSDVTLKECEICIPICYREVTESKEWRKNQSYNYGDVVLWEGQIWVWLGYDDTYTQRPDISKAWSLRGAADCIPFLGGNDFRPHDDCDDFTVIPENPEVTGTTITTNPEIFKDGIFNVGGQDCFDSTYDPCEELTDPCGCMVTYGEFNDGSVLFEVGDVVCCPEEPNPPYNGLKWVRVGYPGSCNMLELFIPDLCSQTPPDTKCWRVCEPETEGEGVTSGGIWGKEIVRRSRPGIISNSPVDPCDPDYGSMPSNLCDCEGIGFRNLDLDFYLLPNANSIPPSVMNFAMSEDAQDPFNWVQSISSINPNPIAYKAQINACCLGDKLTHYFRVYAQAGNLSVIGESPNQISYGDYQIDFDVDQNCTIEFYHITVGDGVRLYMHIPQSTISNNATISVVDNPLLGQTYLTNDVGTTNYFNNLDSLTFEIGRFDTTTDIFQIFKVSDSNFLTDNGTNSTNEELNDIFDRYWAQDPFIGETPLYGALDQLEITKIVDTPSSSISNIGKYRYNWEMELSCEGQQTLELSFTLNSFSSLPSGGASGISTGIGKDPASIIGTPLLPSSAASKVPVTGQLGGQSIPSKLPPTVTVPFSDVCGTDMSSPIINQNEGAVGKQTSISNIQTSGNLTDVPVRKAILDVNDDINIENYKIVKSDMFIVSNYNPLQNNRVVNYNFPQTKIDLKEGRTYETFNDNNTERVKLAWLDDFTKNGKAKINIEFVSKENQKRFEQDLQLKNVGQGVEYLPTYGRENTIPQSTVGKTTFIDLRDWATRSVGNIKDFSNSNIVYGKDNLLKRFEIGPTFTTTIANSQYKVGLVPIGDPSTEFIISTMGYFEDYLNYQTGTTSSAVTMTLSGLSGLYSGYTNLSGYTNNQGLNLSPDFVFDLSLLDNKMSIETGVPLSDPTFSENKKVDGLLSNDFKFIGDDRKLRPAIPLKTLSENNQLFFIPREEVSSGGDYFYYKVPKTQNYRLQYKSCVYFEYFDEGWCTYLDTYRSQSNNLFPVNDYDFKQLINSSIIYGGGDVSANYIYNEGNVVNDRYTELGIQNNMAPIFGYNPGNGIQDFEVNVYVERKLSGTTATTIIGNYKIASNPTQHPDANEYLFLPLNGSDKFTNLYECSGLTATTKVFEKKFIPYIDTGCINLNKDDEIRLRINIEWENTTKNNSTSVSTSGLTASTISLKVGTNNTPLIPERPWFRVINKECNVPESTTYLYWQPNEKGPVSTELFAKGKAVPVTQGSEIGKLVFVDRTTDVDYVTPNIRVNTLQNLNYLDIPAEKNYVGDLKLIPTSKKTNRWSQQLEKNNIKDFEISSSKVLDIKDDMEVLWNVPIPTKNNIESISLDDPKYTFMAESTVQVKGTNNTFTILNTYKPDIKSDTTKDIKIDVSTLVSPNNITYTSSRPLEERTIGFEDNRTIIRERVVAVESVIYDKNTPTVDKDRVQYCKCADASYLAVPSDSTIGCNRWCCVNSYKDSTYYPCEEKTINEWAAGLNLTRVVMPSPKNGIIRGL